MNKVLKGVLVVLAVASCSGEALSKEWRKIVPLISTRADVEQLLGKPGKLNRYQFDDERASILYSSGPCTGSDLGLRANCKCQVPKDTVLAIYVEPEIALKFRSLNLDRRNFTRTPSMVDPMRVSYSNETEGVDYTVDETDDEILMVEYFHSAHDCRKIVERNSRSERNRWRGLVPMHSTRADVVRLLGEPNAGSKLDLYLFKKDSAVDFKYANGDCIRDHGWKVPKDTILTISVTPHRKILLSDLRLDLTTYGRTESRHPNNMFYYTNLSDGLTIRTRLLGGVETVDNIEYGPTTKDIGLACDPPQKR